MEKRICYYCALIAFLLVGNPINLLAEPTYANIEAKRIIGLMLEAHGGYGNWKNKPSVSYTHTYIGPHDPTDPWKSNEIVEQGRRRVYQEWPLDNAEIIFNGTGYYGINWMRGNPPKFTAHLAYYFGNLPFLTQDDGVILTATGKSRILNDTREYLTVKMTFKTGSGVDSKDYYELYIDPNTYILKATKYIVTYGALLDAFELPVEVEHIGPFYKFYDTYTTVDGIKLPTKLSTLSMDGEDYGYHLYENWDLNQEFQSSKIQIPKNAVLDTSSATRAMK